MDFFINQTGQRSVLVGGVRSLLEFGLERVVLSVPGAVVEVCGEKLGIGRFDQNEITVTGRIESVTTTKRSGRGV